MLESVQEETFTSNRADINILPGNINVVVYVKEKTFAGLSNRLSITNVFNKQLYYYYKSNHICNRICSMQSN